MNEPKAFPSWIFAGALLLAAGYLPTLNTPFDFIDDGNLIYPSRGLTLTEHASLWWERVAGNVEHLGPFRPVVWLHWQLCANILGDDPLLWRTTRLLWCAVASGMFLWLMRELKLHPVAALLAAAAAMWNPYRNDIWTSLTLAEGIAMPYAILALVAARKATSSTRPAMWDGVAILALIFALGCKNTFVALLPAMLFLRVAHDGSSFRDRFHAVRGRLAFYLLPIALPAGHFVYFKLHPSPNHYQTPGPSWDQAKHFFLWLKGTAGMDYLGIGLAVLAAALVFKPEYRKSLWQRESRTVVGTSALLIACGFLIYLPVNIMTGRYTMPAVWGVDLLIGLLLTNCIQSYAGNWQRVSYATIGLGLVCLTVANVSRQDKLRVRSEMLWEVVYHLEECAPPGAVVAWYGGSHEASNLNTEEGIHLLWHIQNRQKADVQLALFDASGKPVSRVEVPPVSGPQLFRVLATEAVDPLYWKTDRVWVKKYHYGLRAHHCVVQSRIPEPEASPSVLDPAIAKILRESFGNPGSTAERLLPGNTDTKPSMAELLGNTRKR